MTIDQIKQAAKEAVAHARRRYGSGWEHVTPDARIGAAVLFASNAFDSYAPDSPASNMTAVVRHIKALCE